MDFHVIKGAKLLYSLVVIDIDLRNFAYLLFTAAVAATAAVVFIIVGFGSR